ncbi:helix-turn-helix domain-containing protein [Orrella dioscoreae]|uniref:helix-turn-helix domain-containing protein n=1 Tax=Orrella dioscoreae TaxID=1851544 RepID=UPI0009F3A974|nr:helix-turn-helix domain-containing protein [Orrella dioscoreae]
MPKTIQTPRANLTKSKSPKTAVLPPVADRPAPKTASVTALHGGALHVSVEVAPLLDIVRKHVRTLTQAKERAIREEFVQIFQLALPAQARTSDQAMSQNTSDPVLTSQEAADLVGVSRPYMVARIDAGDVALHRWVGNQRRVLTSSVLAWQQKEQAGKQRAMQKLGALLDDEIFSS